MLAAAALLICTGFAVRQGLTLARTAREGWRPFNDFFAQWSFALFARVNEAASIYHPDALHRFQLGLEPALRQSFPFPYPPTYLFAVWPLGALPFGAAQLLWDALGLGLFLWAALGRRWRTEMLAFVVLAPATVISLSYGQNGLLISALLVGGMRAMPRRPTLGGILLGLATIKPQFLLLLPFALVAAREWRVVAASAVTASTLAALAAVCFGPQAWPAWLGAAEAHAAWLQASVSDYRKPTVMATLSLFGADPALAQAAQLFVAVLVAAVVTWCFRRGPTDLAIASVQSGTYLALPFFFAYDMPMLVSAVLLFVRDRQRSGRPWHVAEAGIVGLGLLFPALTTVTTRFFYMNTVALVLLFGLIATRALAGNETAPAA